MLLFLVKFLTSGEQEKLMKLYSEDNIQTQSGSRYISEGTYILQLCTSYDFVGCIYTGFRSTNSLHYRGGKRKLRNYKRQSEMEKQKETISCWSHKFLIFFFFASKGNNASYSEWHNDS